MSVNNNKRPIALLKTACSTIFSNPVILYPFCFVAFVQILALEILFFAPRDPLSHLFKPVIVYFFGEAFLQYPRNYFVLASLFQHKLLQYPIYVIVSSYFFGVAVSIINLINNDRTIQMKSIFKQTLSRYVHLATASLIIVFILDLLTKAYGMVVERALLIRSISGPYYILKQTMILGAPYFNLIITLFVTTVFAFLIPIIVIEKKNIFLAVIDNFKYLFKSFWFIFIINFIPILLYIPFLLLKTNNFLFSAAVAPELLGLLIFASIFITLLIDAIQFTAITIYFLLKKEAR